MATPPPPSPSSPSPSTPGPEGGGGGEHAPTGRGRVGNEQASELAQPGHTDPLSMPVSDEWLPRLPFPVVGIGASAGGLEALIELVQAIPADTESAYVIIQHLPPDNESRTAEILRRHAAPGLIVTDIDDGMEVRPGTIYVIRPAYTLVIQDGRLRLTESIKHRGHRHPVDDFFRSLAEEQRERAIAVVLSGMGSNGTAGAAVINTVGGLCIAQDPLTAKYASMPQSLINAHHADYVLAPGQIPEVIRRYVAHPYTKSRRAEMTAQRDRKAYGEILSVLRTRTQQEFAGYKRPTVMRRIQRRMGIHHTVDMTEYASLVRQNVAEARALAEEIVIHVTGFFRDPEAWESLREKVPAPLAESRVAEAESERTEIRAWVTACSTGEEPYTLAILLHEAVEKAGGRIGTLGGVDIKVFATDLVDRTLAVARSGLYPLGIEAEVRPDRLERYFEKDDSAYRIKKEIRELVVFAPQNVLQDPPFSRLDIVTCRNLLIYLEPEVQQRLLGLLHFGLRDTGALMLGNSETVGGADELFAPIDKKWRLYRRVGPTRSWRPEFPSLRAMLKGAVLPVFDRDAIADGDDGAPARPDQPARTGAAPGNGNGGGVIAGFRFSIPQMAQRVLLERYTPAAVVIDRQQRVVYFHGDTGPFLVHPHGEPTRELLPLVREHLRGAVRLALFRSSSADAGAAPAPDAPGLPGAAVTVRDGHMDTPQGRMRIEVTVGPLDGRGVSSGDYWLVSFAARPEPVEEADTGVAQAAADDGDEPARSAELVRELQRTRDELQGTVEELQSSNEELKAANEEVTSINEELQSTNEELETSKEELQSFNEELTTVNAQLQNKMEELEATTNDLGSLLSSTDIAVVFLDSQFRIRRFTAAVRDLLDLIPADIGRPLSSLPRKFTDPELLTDAQAVLERLIPIEREITGESGRVFARRILPYRTTDNRIDGVVVTFLEITRLRNAERARGRSEEQFRLVVQSFRSYAIIITDAAGIVTSWNSGAERLLGFSSNDAVGRPIDTLLTPEDRAAGLFAHDREAAAKGRVSRERTYVGRDGKPVRVTGVTEALNEDKALRGFVTILRLAGGSGEEF